MKNFLLLLCFLWLTSLCAKAQKAIPLRVEEDAVHHRINIKSGGQLFTSFLFSDTLDKPCLFPVYAPDGVDITRGYPLAPRPNEDVDHRHHTGMWFTYENVNGVDFWSTSSEVPPARREKNGRIVLSKNPVITNGKKPSVSYAANWVNSKNDTLLEEETQLFFSAQKDQYIIDRITTLNADTDVTFRDSKDGLLAMRVTKALQIPKNINDTASRGDFLTSEGKMGDSAWGTRASWCLLYGRAQKKTENILILDHPMNAGYPTYWHARGYGLFAANPFGQKFFSKGKESLNMRLKKGKSTTFRYRVVITSAAGPLSKKVINNMASHFAAGAGQ